METFVYCQISEPEFGSSTSCAVRLDDDGIIKDFVDCSTHDTNYVWDINFPPRKELIKKSFSDLEKLCNDACNIEEDSYRHPFMHTYKISKEDFMKHKLHSLTKDAKWFSHDGSCLSESFLNEYNQAIPELKEFCDEKEFGNLQQIIVGLKIRDIKKTKASNEEKPKDLYEERSRRIKDGDKPVHPRKCSRIKKTPEETKQQREEVKQTNTSNHYKNLKKIYKDSYGYGK